MRNWLAIAAVLFAGLMGGCRFKGGESFMSATEPNSPDHPKVSGDPYTYAGIVEASGGTQAKTPYGATAKANVPGKLDASFDQPMKGVGSQPGEFPNAADAGFGLSNGPGQQPQPEDASSLSVRTGQ